MLPMRQAEVSSLVVSATQPRKADDNRGCFNFAGMSVLRWPVIYLTRWIKNWVASHR